GGHGGQSRQGPFSSTPSPSYPTGPIHLSGLTSPGQERGQVSDGRPGPGEARKQACEGHLNPGEARERVREGRPDDEWDRDRGQRERDCDDRPRLSHGGRWKWVHGRG
ncbi:MAG TPA: hypothetical protein VF204_23280, partial [Streptosporangiaceae bacterium]